MWAPLGRCMGPIIREAAYTRRVVLAPTVVEIDGIRLLVRSRSISRTLQRAIYRGSYERRERSVVERTLMPDDRVLEIGAGAGYLSVVCARRVGSDRVVCYEANRELAALWQENCRLNGVAPHLVEACVTPGGEARTFHVASEFASSSATRRPETARSAAVPAVDFVSVLQDCQANYLVLDVEGLECELLKQPLPRSLTRICVEVHPHVTGDGAVSKMIVALLESGFAIDIDHCLGRVLFFTR